MQEESSAARSDVVKDGDLSEEGYERRRALAKIGFAVAGIGLVAIAGTALLDFVGTNHETKSESLANGANRIVSVSSSTSTSAFSTQSVITVKVVYFGMPIQTTGTKQEYITLHSPVFLKDIISEVTQRHPALISMIGSMQILIDGNPAEPNQQLSNKQR